MAVQSSTNRVQYVGNNSTVTAYSVPFYFFEDSDLVVVVTDADGDNTTLTLNVGYSVTGAGAEAGGSIVTAAAYDSTHTVTIWRELPITQETEYEESDEFPAASHERALDKLTMLIQQLSRENVRAFRLDNTADEFDALAPVNDSILALSASGAPELRTRSALISWLNLTASFVGYGTKQFADAAERALAVPDFVGQLGAQEDTGGVYVSDGLTAGDWALYTTTPAAGSVTAAMLAATLDLSGKTMTLPDGVVGAGKLASTVISGQSAATSVDPSHLFLVDAGGTLKKVTKSNLGFAGGAVHQIVYKQMTGVKTVTGAGMIIPDDDTVPSNLEGDEIVTLEMDNVVFGNKVIVEASGFVSSSLSNTTGIFALFHVASNTCLAVIRITDIGQNDGRPFFLKGVHSSPASGLHEYSLRAGIPAGGNTKTVIFNGKGANVAFGTASSVILTATECVATLDT